MKKSILALLLVLVLAFTVVGCGDDKGNSADSEQAENDRKAIDIEAISDTIHSADAIAADPAFMDEVVSGFKFTITISKGKCTVSSDSQTINNEWISYVGFDSSGYKLKSKDFSKVSNTYTGIVQPSGAVSWSADSTDAMMKFSSKFANIFAK